MTEFVFRSQSYLKIARRYRHRGDARTAASSSTAPSSTPTPAASPSDTGRLDTGDGLRRPVANGVHPEGDKTRIVHVPAEGQPAVAPAIRSPPPSTGTGRYRLMRMHTALHLVSVVFPFPVTGAARSARTRAALDFDMPEAPANLDEREATAQRDGRRPITR